ncbi:Flp pilus assembly protein CpaB [Noviherbaspirillum saxi]|uniref:Flp pilus assembly protein CpaB n=1 Tax=Noviherbaspirillum saxi TaxID=2320863 RepID=A0A3A3FHJ2_9BURK|nr:Flp pilus assembly protein CpaB [Noviherbaspirillum saxi]RJF92630.1 Flp pilus assembly protein CpaB [Noviherbaspirillum saxi]
MKNTRAILIMVVAIAAGLAAVFFASRWLMERSNIGVGKIAVAAVDINLGQRLTPEIVKMVDWPAGSMPPGSFIDPKKLDGRVLKVSVMRGEPLMEAKLAPIGTKGGLSAVITEGKRAITVRVNDVIGVAGFALPGNYVDIIVSTQKESAGNEQNKNISKIVLERILVLAVAQEVSRDDTKPRVVNAVTLEVSPEQAEKLDLARSVGTLSLALRNQIDPKPGTTEGATKISLLSEKLPPPDEPKPVVKKIKARAPAPAPLTCVGVITGSRGSQECY